MPNMTPEIRALYRASLKRLKDAGKEAKPLYHYSSNPETLIESPRIDLGANEPWKPAGIYASDNLRDNVSSLVGDTGNLSSIKQLINMGKGMRGTGLPEDRYVRIVPKPDAIVDTVPEHELIRAFDRGGDATPNADITKITGVDEGAVSAEYILRNPEKFSIFGKDKAWNPAIAGAILGGTAAALTPDESSAFPLGDLRKLDPKLLAKYSRTLDPYHALNGKTLNLAIGDEARQPHTIVDVMRRGTKGDDRLVKLVTPDGEYRQLPMTKDYLNVLLGATGTQTYVDAFKGKKYGEAKLQAVKSLVRRQNTQEAGPLTTQKSREAWNNMQAAKANEIDPGLVNDYVYFKPVGEPQVYVPTPYADMLAAKGFGEIVKPGPNPGGVLTEARKPIEKRAYTKPISEAEMMKNYNANAAKLSKPEVDSSRALRETTEEERNAVREHLQKYYLENGAPDSIATYMQDYTKILREIIRRRE